MIVILIGPPGVGKGTQADLISKKYNLSILSTGEIFRNAIKSGSELGKQVENIVNGGELVSDEIVCKLVESALEEKINSSVNERKSDSSFVDNLGFILDGFPRTIAQAQQLENICRKFNIKKIVAINISMPSDQIIVRIKDRFVCKVCKHTYNSSLKPTKVPGICDICGSKEFYKRKDDNEESIRKRLELYHIQTKPLIDFYQKSDKLLRIDGSKKIDQIFNNITSLIDGLK